MHPKSGLRRVVRADPSFKLTAIRVRQYQRFGCSPHAQTINDTLLIVDLFLEHHYTGFSVSSCTHDNGSGRHAR